MINLKSKNLDLKNLELIIFDKDGTITDSHFFWIEIIKRRAKRICLEYKLDEKILPILQESMGMDIINKRLSPKGPVAIEGRAKVIESIIQTLNKHQISVNEIELIGILKEVHNEFGKDAHNYVKPIDSACNFIKKLSNKKVKLALITSDSTRNANIVLETLDLKNSFDLIVGGDSDHGSKKSGGPAVFACKELNISPNKTIALGDAEMDFLMAKNANLLSGILLATGQIPLETLKKYTSFSFESLNEISIS